MARRPLRERGKLNYAKPPLSHGQLVDRLTERGLAVPDVTRAQRYLRHIGYYRLSPYTIPFQVPGTEHGFRAGTEFDDVLDLYVFDRKLRLLILDALERVEVAVRSATTDQMALHRGGPHWYLDTAHFQHLDRHAKMLSLIEQTCRARLESDPEAPTGGLDHRSALEHYLLNYGTPELPPSWLMVETLTIGQLNSLIANLRRRDDRSAIAASLGIKEPLLLSWLRSYVRVRNICAHHGRLWNAGLGVYPALPRSAGVSWLQAPEALSERPDRRKRLYPVLVSLQCILDTISPRSSWARRLSDLLNEHPRVPRRGMGMPDDWEADPFWSRHLT
jgi:abortive infection bacteriophage resistance protein